MTDTSIPSPATPRSPLGIPLGDDLVAKLAGNQWHIFWVGVGLTLVGILALLFPIFTSLTVELMFGWVLVFAGLVTLYGAFSVEGTGPFFGELLLGLIQLAIGVYLLTHPGVGMVFLTLLLAGVFIVDGAVQIKFAYDMKPKQGWGWVLASGIISIAAGLVIASGMPETSLFVLGLVVGINFLSTGIAFMLLSSTLPKTTT